VPGQDRNGTTDERLRAVAAATGVGLVGAMMFAVNGHWFGAVGAAFLAVSAVGKIMEIRATGNTVEDAVPAESAGLARTDSSPTVAQLASLRLPRGPPGSRTVTGADAHDAPRPPRLRAHAGSDPVGPEVAAQTWLSLQAWRRAS